MWWNGGALRPAPRLLSSGVMPANGESSLQIVLATDGSREARDAGQWLLQVPLPPASVVSIVAVAGPLGGARTMPGVREALLAEAHRVAREAGDGLRGRWPAAAVQVVEGEPREEIRRVAEERRADLLVVGARGLGRFAGALLGSVSAALAREAPCAVLVAKSRPRPITTTIVAVDGSEDARAGVRLVARLAWSRPVRVCLLGVLERPRSLRGRARLDALLAEERLARKAEIEGVLGEAAARFDPGVVMVETVCREGRPAEEILAAARAQGAELVVVGARGGGPRGLGSVAETVVRHAGCPVLLART
jgi:nucleotide-binding universal stress UspA family protein